MKEETQETRIEISNHKTHMQVVIEAYWAFLRRLRDQHKITEARYNHLKTFPQRFTDYELKEQENEKTAE